MTKSCVVCKRKGIVYIPYARASFCREHFIEFYNRKILRTLRNSGFKSGKILVGVSGGKDSVSLLYALSVIRKEMNLEIEALHINLGIGRYSLESYNAVKKLEKILPDIRFHYFDLRELGFTIPEVVKAIKRPACSVCGAVKRWILNKFAYEKGFEFIATGHNIDDISTFYLKALLTQRIEDIMRGPEPLTPGFPDLKLVGRIRPQFYLSEMENTLYATLQNLPFVDFPCPLARGATLFKYKNLWKEILSTNPVAQINFVKSIIAIKKRIPKETQKLKSCEICGYPTTAADGVCFVCRLRKKFGVL
ncbi:MAG: ATP-binding protein [Candidatus Njordarchaeales archaeon]